MDLAKSEEKLKEQEALMENGQENHGFCGKIVNTKTSRLSSMLGLIIVYFLAEAVVGHLTSSLTLIADSFHMLSDALSLVVALVAVRLSKRGAQHSITPWPSKQAYFNTFGWVRFEVVGALINSTFLFALCISITMEAIEKFYDPGLISQPELVLAVGGCGLLINVIGLVLFGGHAHAGHNHSHGHDHGHNHGHDNHHNHLQNNNGSTEQHMNMKAVFLHVLGDALGSVIVMISATIIYLVPYEENVTVSAGNATAVNVVINVNEWIMYIDPAMSIVLVLIMIFTTYPLFKESSLVLLQTVPKHIKLQHLKEKIKTIEGVQEIQNFHLWQLTGEKLVATVHVWCNDAISFLRIAEEIKQRLNDAGIHSTTIQPEFYRSPKPYCMVVSNTDTRESKNGCSRNDIHAISKNSSKPIPHSVTKVDETKFNSFPRSQSQSTNVLT
uniref:zinc transporter 1-like isoform X2 n=1 Tax=Ciona intestinalis TaxID=7719 RepID=UPI000180B9AA|nr:zinc transporter 1-like isoform X2 [Ciona intestinalis]|eukprot:XP_002128192.1 zinc transporter 1-like isoform X2 [Ciona intestinalis]